MLQPKKPVKVMEKKIDVKVKPKPAPPKAKGMQRAFKYNFPLNVETASAQNGAKVKDKTAVKVTPKKPKDFISKVKKGLSKLTMKDVKDSAETALNLSTLGGYGVVKKKVKELTGLKSGGSLKPVSSDKVGLKKLPTAVRNKMGYQKNGGMMKKAKSGTSLGMKSVKSGYDDNSGVTRADFVAIGKGTAQNGFKANPYAKMDKARVIAKGYKETTNGKFTKPKMKMGGKTPKKMQYGGKAASMVPMKMGGAVKKAQDGGDIPGLAERAGPMVKTKTKVRSPDGNYVTKKVTTNKPNSKNSTTKTRRTLQGFITGAPRVNDLKNGGKMAKCKYGCK